VIALHKVAVPLPKAYAPGDPVGSEFNAAANAPIATAPTRGVPIAGGFEGALGAEGEWQGGWTNTGPPGRSGSTTRG
jgi:hypothetical protein